MILQRLASAGHILTISAATSKTIDEVGSYRPVESENQVTLDDAKIKAWISKGVVVTPTVKSLLNGKGISLDRKQG